MEYDKKQPQQLSSALKPSLQQKFSTVFSDDEEEETSSSPWAVIPSLRTQRASFSPRFIDPLQTSTSYHIHQAEMALFNLKSAVLYHDRPTDMSGGWKKVLKHKKSGVVIYMKTPSPSVSSTSYSYSSAYPTSSMASASISSPSADKIPIFKGEAIFEGFTPHSIFYVIGMRKLWDDQYEDGNLVENLNDTTSLTYEVCKPTSSSKSRRDLCLVEKIECTQNGTILFACTSVETPKVPRLQGRVRAHVKLMGWALEPLSSGPMPLTKVTFVIQEPVKGWMSGLTKKSLARRPLVISLVHDYLKAKAERIRITEHHHHHLQQQQIHQSRQQPWVSRAHTIPRKRPSVMVQSSSAYCHKNSLPCFQSQRTISTNAEESATNAVYTNKRITFADDDTHSTATSPTASTGCNIPSALVEDSSRKQLKQQDSPSVSSYGLVSPPLTPSSPLTAKASLYPPHRHLAARNESVSLLKQLYASLEGWQLEHQSEHTKIYNRNYQGTTYSRMDGKIQGDWLPEQICATVQCIHTRSRWDDCWKEGRVVERFSQKDYLVHWMLITRKQNDTPSQKDMAVMTHIDSENGGSKIFLVSKSVQDSHIPEKEGYERVHMALYGWVFSTVTTSKEEIVGKNDDNDGNSSNNDNKKKNNKKAIMVSFIVDASLPWAYYSIDKTIQQTRSEQCMLNIQSFLSQNGCRPYIRRVSGKVTLEHFDTDATYLVTWIAKHQPPSSYQRQHHHPHHHKSTTSNLSASSSPSSASTPKSSLWCTEIRVDHFMYPDGYHVEVIPTQGTRIEMEPNQKTIMVFTTDHSMEGATLHLKITRIHSQFQHQCNRHHQHRQHRHFQHHHAYAHAHAHAHEEREKYLENNMNLSVTESTSEISTNQSLGLNGNKSNVSSHSHQDIPSSPSSTLSSNSNVIRKSSNSNSSNNKQQRSVAPHLIHCVSPVHSNHTLQVPKGYILIPQPNQHQHLINLTNDLTFNGQQLVVIFFGMVMSYYMGKLACSCQR